MPELATSVSDFSVQGFSVGEGPTGGSELAHSGAFSILVWSIIQAGISGKGPWPAEAHNGNTYTRIIDQPFANAIAATNSARSVGSACATAEHSL